MVTYPHTALLHLQQLVDPRLGCCICNKLHDAPNQPDFIGVLHRERGPSRWGGAVRGRLLHLQQLEAPPMVKRGRRGGWGVGAKPHRPLKLINRPILM